MKIEVCFDVYNISKRIKNIDRDYYVVYDTSRQKYEVHNKSQLGSSYCLTLPFNNLDERALTFVMETQSTNIDRILNQIENNNKSRESTEKNSALSCIYDSIEEKLRS